MSDRKLSSKDFDCPFCGATYSLADCDVYPHVTSYHGEEPHRFICSECDETFLVKEHVTRDFETAKTYEELW